MPVLVTKHDNHTRQYSTYKLYTKDEIVAQWAMFKQLHLKKMSKGDDIYVTMSVRSEEEAIVIIALMMRRTGALPNTFYYDIETNKVLSNCTVSGKKFTDTRDAYLSLAEMFLPDKNLKNMVSDPVGQELFGKSGEPNKTHTEYLKNGVNINNLHEHIDCLSFMGFSGMESM